jgi:hypothetical protein
VNLIAAPAGPRQVGIVSETPAKSEPEAPLPKRAEMQPKETVPVRRRTETRRTTSRATQVPDAKSARFDTPAPKAGGANRWKGPTSRMSARREGIPFRVTCTTSSPRSPCGLIRARNRC